MAMERKTGVGIGLFIGGALVGAGLALLFAPAKGEDTRRQVGDWLKKKGTEGKDLFVKGKVEATHKKDQLAAALKAGKEAYVAYNGGSKEKVAA